MVQFVFLKGMGGVFAAMPFKNPPNSWIALQEIPLDERQSLLCLKNAFWYFSNFYNQFFIKTKPC